MRRYFVIAMVFMAVSLVFSQPEVPLAQEEEGEEELGYSWGIVSSVSADRIVVKEYDYDSDTEVNVSYGLDPEVDLNNVSSLKDIAVGDSVEIDFEVVGGKNVAKVIFVEKPEYSSDESDEDIEY